MNITNRKVANNALWLIGCKVVQSVLSLIVSMLTARYLGPSNYGVINYAASVVAFILPLVKLGFDSILVQEIIENPNDEGTIVGTAIFLNVVSSFFAIIGVISFVYIANPGEKVTLIVCGLYSLQLIAIALEMIQYWYQAKLLSKYVSLVSLCAYVCVSIYKIFLLITQKSVYWFAVSNAIDYIIIALILMAFFWKRFKKRLLFSKKVGYRLLVKGKYYIFANMMIAVFGQTDRIMLKVMLGDTATGYYSAALACATITNFVFTAVIDSMRPLILSSKKENESLFENNVIRLYSMIIYAALIQSVVVSIGAEWIVGILYGDVYAPAGKILRLLVWYTPFSYLGPARNIWILAEGKYKQLWKINLMGAIANITLLFICIPTLGIVGAALSAVITQLFTNIFTGFLIKDIRYNNRLIFKSINPKYLLEVLTSIKNIKH